MNKHTSSGPESVATRPTACKGTILVVEDEKLVAWDVEQTLREFGYSQVVVATTLKGARDLFHIHGDEIILTILDVKLEDGDGTSLIEEIHLQGSHVIVMTGYNGLDHLNAPVLQKPFSTAALVQTINSLLGHSP